MNNLLQILAASQWQWNMFVLIWKCFCIQKYTHICSVHLSYAEMANSKWASEKKNRIIRVYSVYHFNRVTLTLTAFKRLQWQKLQLPLNWMGHTVWQMNYMKCSFRCFVCCVQCAVAFACDSHGVRIFAWARFIAVLNPKSHNHNLSMNLYGITYIKYVDLLLRIHLEWKAQKTVWISEAFNSIISILIQPWQ